MRHRVRYHELLQLAAIQRVDRISTEYAVRDDGDGFSRTVIDNDICSFDERTTCVGHVVDDDSHFALHITHENHARDFVGSGALFVDECEAEVEAVSDGRCSDRGKLKSVHGPLEPFRYRSMVRTQHTS